MQTYEGITDAELVELGRGGDDDAVDFLLGKYKPLVLRLSRSRFLAGGDREDLLQEGMIGLYKAIRDFDASRQVPFYAFASLCVDRQMLHAIEAAQREKNRVLNDSFSLSEEEWEAGAEPVGEGPEELVLLQESTDSFITELLSSLSPLEKQVFELSLQDLDYREIADMLGKSPKSIDNALTRIRQKSRKVLW